MRVVEIIGKKRDGGALSDAEIAFVIDGYTAGEITDYQMSALLMAILFQGMTLAETSALTGCMLASGATLDLKDLGRPVVDKHSTGGVGDKTSLIIAPIAAEAGCLVPMISGRALGHTGGTLDKLEAISGFRTNLSLDEFRGALEQNGASFIGQTPEIAPADKRLYALRDATGTVPSVPLIVGSIMSKKLAEGLDALVLDVKTGSGAFMKTINKARTLARSLVQTGERAGAKVEAFISTVDQPIGRAVGNANEVAECIDVLRGDGPEDLTDLSLDLAASMIELCGLAQSREDSRARAEAIVASGAALERFRAIVETQGGDPAMVDDPSRLPTAPVEVVARAERAGFVASVDAESVGWAVMSLGAGRVDVSSAIDPSVGLHAHARVGDQVGVGDALAVIRCRDEATGQDVARRVAASYVIGEEAVIARPLVLERIGGGNRA